MDSLRENFLKTIWQKYPPKPSHHCLMGRVVAVGDSYLDLQLNPLERVNLKINSDWSERLRVGDWVSSDGENEITLLAPNLNSIPASVSAEKLKSILLWNQFRAGVRQFFNEQSFVEVQTPTLVVCPGTEPYLDVFQVDQWFLPTSPELSLKKVLARGIPKIFEIRPCFRKNEFSETHRPEFWMLEWYRQGEDLTAIKKDVENLVEFLVEKMKLQHKISFRAVTVSELFRTRCDFELRPETNADELRRLAENLGIKMGSIRSFDDLFFLLFLEKIERDLKKEGMVFVEKYPPSQAALARLTADGWGDRFEFYWQGLEIANAFHELNDPQIQRQRFQEDLEKKLELGKVPVPVDTEFLAALDSGMPPSAGIALGLERLFMALTGIEDIAELRL